MRAVGRNVGDNGDLIVILNFRLDPRSSPYYRVCAVGGYDEPCRDGFVTEREGDPGIADAHLLRPGGYPQQHIARAPQLLPEGRANDPVGYDMTKRLDALFLRAQAGKAETAGIR